MCPQAYQTSPRIPGVRDPTGLEINVHGQCLFGPVLIDQPAGEAAERPPAAATEGSAP